MYDAVITDEMFNQMQTVRETGLVNMFDLQGVSYIAEEMGFDDLDLLIKHHDDAYVDLILNGRR